MAIAESLFCCTIVAESLFYCTRVADLLFVIGSVVTRRLLAACLYWFKSRLLDFDPMRACKKAKICYKTKINFHCHLKNAWYFEIKKDDIDAT